MCVEDTYHIPFAIHSISGNMNSVFEALDPALAHVEHVGALSLSNAKSAPIVEDQYHIVDDQYYIVDDQREIR